MKIVLADDHSVVMLGASKIIDSSGGHSVVGCALNASDLMMLVREHCPDAVITDYNMPGDAQYGDGLVFIGGLIRKFPGLKIVVYTMVKSPVIIDSLYEAGVSAVVFKSGDEHELLSALSSVAEGKVYRPNSKLGGRALLGEVAVRVDSLSPRESEVIRHFLSGTSVGDIAVLMNRSVKTISTHKIAAMRKLGVSTDHELVMLGLRHDLFG